jgi:exonuclease VII small subunit
VAWFESDLFVVEQAIEKFKEAEQLADEIEQELNEYKNTITVLKQKFTQE